MILTCVIIEDEPLAADKLAGFIRRVPFLELTASFDNALDGLSFIKNNRTDILFLDIQMEKLTGIQLLESLSRKPYVIITTAYSEYAVKGYELQISDYLLKPYSFERFLSSVNRVSDDFSMKNSNEVLANLFVKTEYRIENIAADDILFIKGMQSYLQIVMRDRKIMTKQSFKSLMAQLPQGKFIQVHKSWAVSISKIESVERNRIKIAGNLIPIGDTFRDAFYLAINVR
ncbi:MAG: LytR/AlgR family response regulator transcription factor [Bacteroidota bacterium]